MATLPAIQPLRVPDPLQGYAAVQNILASQQQQQVNALAMEKARREAEREAALTNYLTSANLSTPEGVAGLTRFGKPGLEYQTALGQAETARLTRAKTQADLITSKLAQGRQMFAMAPTPAALADAAKAQFSDPVLGPVLTRMNLSPDSLAAYIAQKSATPEGFAQVKLEFASTADQMVDQLKGQLQRFERGRLLGDETTPATPTAPTAPAVPAAAAAMPAVAPATAAAAPPVFDPGALAVRAGRFLTPSELRAAQAQFEAQPGAAAVSLPVTDLRAAPVNALGVTPAAPVSALVTPPVAPAVQVAGPTEMPTAAAPSAAVQEQIASLRAQQRRALAAGEKDIAAYFGNQITSLEAQTDPRKRYVVVGNQIFDVAAPQFITPPPLPGRLGAAAPAGAAREARTKAPPADVAAMQQLGYPLTPEGYAQFKAAGRKPAAAPAAAPGAPAAGTPAQQAKAEAQQAAQTKLSQDLQTQLGYYEELAKMGAMSSPGRPVVANVLAYARSSGLGQEAERAAGTKAQTLRDNIANARQRILMHVKNATSATAGQMNSNMELQTWLRSLTDPQQSIETVRETLKQMDFVIAGVREQVAREAAAKRGASAAPAAAPAPAPAPAAANRREIAPGVFVTERP